MASSIQSSLSRRVVSRRVISYHITHIIIGTIFIVIIIVIIIIIIIITLPIIIIIIIIVVIIIIIIITIIIFTTTNTSIIIVLLLVSFSAPLSQPSSPSRYMNTSRHSPWRKIIVYVIVPLIKLLIALHCHLNIFGWLTYAKDINALLAAQIGYFCLCLW